MISTALRWHILRHWEADKKLRPAELEWQDRDEHHRGGWYLDEHSISESAAADLIKIAYLKRLAELQTERLKRGVASDLNFRHLLINGLPAVAAAYEAMREK